MSAAGNTRMGCEEPRPPAIGQPFNPFKRFLAALIPEQICRYRGISPGAKLIYGRLYRYAGENGVAFPAIPTLAEETGLGETQARGYIKELEKVGLIAVDRENRHYRKDGSGGSNGYVFLWHDAFTGDSGERRKAPPPLRKTEGVPLRKTEPPTPAENRTRRESGSRGSGKESQSTSDYQPTNRKNRDSHAGCRSDTTDEPPKNQTPEPKPIASEGRRQFTPEEREWMSAALNAYGQRRTMHRHMQESAPPQIVQMCLEAADGTPLRDVGELLRNRCLHGCEPGTGKGPRGWGWFPTVIANAIRSWREQEAAAQDRLCKKHWSEYPVEVDPEMERATSAFDTLDWEATA